MFAPGAGALECPYCGSRTHIPASTGEIVENKYADMGSADIGAGATTEDVASVECDSCAALVEPCEEQEAFACPYCGSSIVARAISTRLIKPQAVLPFRIGRDEATALFRGWIRRLWFAPNTLKKLARLDGRLQGLYAPYWTYDSDTRSTYAGQRGEEYTVTRTRTVTRHGKRVRESYRDVKVRWYPVTGTVSRTFDDMLVVGSNSLPRTLATELEPWDLDNLVAYADEYLSGFMAERYQVDVRRGWRRAQERMEDIIRADVKRDIGGDRQRIDALETSHSRVSFKHILLPMWICSYRYRSRIYRFLVNARTGEVQGERPWSRVKIGLAAAALAALAVALRAYVGA